MPVPPKSVRDAARRGLEAREKATASNKAGTPVGIKRANDLARGANISVNILKRMRSYLARARDNYERARKKGLTAENSKAIQAYLLWGSTSARAWVERELNKLD